MVNIAFVMLSVFALYIIPILSIYHSYSLYVCEVWCGVGLLPSCLASAIPGTPAMAIGMASGSSCERAPRPTSHSFLISCATASMSTPRAATSASRSMPYLSRTPHACQGERLLAFRTTPRHSLRSGEQLQRFATSEVPAAHRAPHTGAVQVELGHES